MKKYFAILLLICVSSGMYNVNAQKDPVKENFYDAEFFLSEEEYKEALYSFQKVYNSGNQENANINYRIGICYLNIPGQKEKSISYLEKAVKNISENYKEGSYTEVSAPADALLYLGNAYRINNLPDKAIDSYNAYLKLAIKINAVDIEYTKQQIESCQRAKEVIKNPTPIYKENLGRNYNTSMNNFQAVFSGDNNSMAYMISQKFYDAAYFVKKINGTWSNPINITPQIESDGNQYISSFSFDGSKLFLIMIDNFDGDIFISDYSQGRWNPSKPIGKPINTKFFESHASFSPDGKTLFFTSNRTGGTGGMDIYTSTLSESGAWSEPVNIGKAINTPLNEETPFIAADGKTLYFSSQGHSTIGGYDVFTSSQQEDKSWSVPVPLPYPINSSDDELFFFPDAENKGGYMTLYEPNGLGDGDIYHIKVISPQDAVASVEPTTEEIKTPVIENKPDAKEPEIPSFKYYIKPIYFGFDSYLLSEMAKEKLNDLVNAMNDYPQVHLEARGYTDSKGSFEYNQILSDKRAKAVTDYLISKGINSVRLKNIGYSESNNVAINAFSDGRDAIEGRKLNRRVEFQIVEGDGALLLIEEIPVPEQLKVK
jgi:outer membrane protein OmpA-like peptidoglycan-associated protein/tetratricopeptide (TPR) repeat protein